MSGCDRLLFRWFVSAWCWGSGCDLFLFRVQIFRAQTAVMASLWRAQKHFLNFALISLVSLSIELDAAPIVVAPTPALTFTRFI